MERRHLRCFLRRSGAWARRRKISWRHAWSRCSISGLVSVSGLSMFALLAARQRFRVSGTLPSCHLNIHFKIARQRSHWPTVGLYSMLQLLNVLQELSAAVMKSPSSLSHLSCSRWNRIASMCSTDRVRAESLSSILCRSVKSPSLRQYFFRIREILQFSFREVGGHMAGYSPQGGTLCGPLLHTSADNT
jgi:hypothetical protein